MIKAIETVGIAVIASLLLASLFLDNNNAELKKQDLKLSIEQHELQIQKLHCELKTNRCK